MSAGLPFSTPYITVTERLDLGNDNESGLGVQYKLSNGNSIILTDNGFTIAEENFEGSAKWEQSTPAGYSRETVTTWLDGDKNYKNGSVSNEHYDKLHKIAESNLEWLKNKLDSST